jgi:hypothetical protein
MTNKKSLIGVFQDMNALAFPTQANCALYIKLVDGIGDYALRIRFVNLSGETLVTELPSIKAHFNDPLAPAEVAVNMVGFLVPEEGRYEFQLYANEIYLSRITMGAKRIILGGPQWQPQKQF